MDGFFVDINGLNGLYNQLVRAKSDADDILHYARTEASMDLGQEGLIMIVAGPHEKAYSRVTKVLAEVSEVIGATATAINSAQGWYARTDQGAAARLDRTYPGATDPAGLRGTLTTSRPDLAPRRAAFTDVAEPSARLAAPNIAYGAYSFDLDPVTDLLSPSAWIRGVCQWVFNRDPFVDWLNTISGDWERYYRCAAVWGHVSAACGDLGANLVSGGAGVPTVWRGQAAEALQEYLLTLTAGIWTAEKVCRELSPLYLQAADAAQKLFATISSLASELLDVLIIINLAGVVGTATVQTGIGAIIGYRVATFYLARAHDLYKEIDDAFSRASEAIHVVAGTITAVQAQLEVESLPDLPRYRHPALG